MKPIKAWPYPDAPRALKEIGDGGETSWLAEVPPDLKDREVEWSYGERSTDYDHPFKDGWVIRIWF